MIKDLRSSNTNMATNGDRSRPMSPTITGGSTLLKRPKMGSVTSYINRLIGSVNLFDGMGIQDKITCAKIKISTSQKRRFTN